jgi:phospholipid/cholesterol/gamma-HCH transport system ATP-binding protein
VNASNPSPVVVFDQVEVRFGTTVVHKNLSFSLNPSEATTILGPSGAGKTIILKLIMGLLAPSGGTVSVLGQNVGELDEQGLIDLRRDVGMLFQGAALFDSLSVFENVAYALRERGEKDEQKLSDLVRDRLAAVGLPGIEAKYPPQLSGGQKKRVGLARALATSPKVMLFDEPTTGLDPTSTRLIDDLIVMLKSQMGISCIAVTHDIQSAVRFSDRWILVGDGTVLADERIQNGRPGDPLVAKFVQGQWGEDV